MAEPDTDRQSPAFTRSLSGLGVIILTLSVLSPGVSVLVSGGSILAQAGTGVGARLPARQPRLLLPDLDDRGARRRLSDGGL